MKKSFFIACLLAIAFATFSQDLQPDSLKHKLGRSLTNIYRETMMRLGRVTVDSIAVNDRKKRIAFYTNLSLSYLPMRDHTVQLIYDSVRYHLPAKQKKTRSPSSPMIRRSAFWCPTSTGINNWTKAGSLPIK